MNIDKLIKSIPTCVHLRNIYKYYNKINTKYIKINNLQDGYLNFYKKEYITPYCPIYSSGPWILTNEQKVIYDAGGYGMLGLGHNPKKILNSMMSPMTMANILTPNETQMSFKNKIDHELKPHYTNIACLNSGSEANTLAMMIANIHNNPNPIQVSLIDSFHGRTESPSKMSYSCHSTYKKYLQRFKTSHYENTYFIEINNIYNLINTFKKIKEKNEFPEITIVEPVMGEGNPGVEMTVQFYNKLRELTKKAGGLLLVDSVQAGFRCKGELSIMKYPGFEKSLPPDMETFSKAINSGQYPLSVLAMNNKVASLYVPGIYGNTMSCNPRALSIGNITLNEINSTVRKNIVTMGSLLKEEFIALENEYNFIEKITGSGLLIAIHFHEYLDAIKVERQLRLNGLNVIHGGKNAIRFTPWFLINKNEIDIIVKILKKTFTNINNNENYENNLIS